MTDDLENRCHEELAHTDGPVTRKLKEQANRIEKLEAELVRTFNNMMGDAKRIEKLEAALRELRAMHYEDGINDLEERGCMTYVVICDALEENNDPAT